MSDSMIRQRPIEAVGVIGTGGVGRSICHRLKGQGQAHGVKRVAAFDADPLALSGLSEAAVVTCGSTADLVGMVDLVLLCLPAAGDVARIARAHEGLLDCVREGHIIVDHSRSSFELSRQLATAFAARGTAFLDAPIGHSANVNRSIEAGRLALSIGGEARAVAAAVAPLKAFAADITPVGAPGCAQVVRQMGDLVALQTFAALAEALVTARTFDIEGDRLFEALAKAQGDAQEFGHHGFVEFLGADEAAPDDRTSIKEAGRRLKDVIQLAEGKHLSLTGADSTLALLERAIEKGLGDEDLSGLFGVMEPENRSAGRDQRQRD